eukprot:sb/3469409/
MRRFCSTPVCGAGTVRSLSIRSTLYPCSVQRDPTTLGSVCQRDPTSLGSVCYKSTSPAVKPTTSYLPAFSLGLSGLIPFYAPPLYMVHNNYTYCLDGEAMHIAYAATILSFIGGVRWGLTLAPGSGQPPDWKNLSYSVTPSLLAWSGLLIQAPLGYIPVTGGLLLAGTVDLLWTGYPAWFKVLRLILSAGALSSIGILLWVKQMEERDLGVKQQITDYRAKWVAWRDSEL